MSLKDRIIRFNETPASIDLKSYHILDCVYSGKKVQERVRIVECDDENKLNSMMTSGTVLVKLQTQEGRKSRVNFLIYKDEPFEKVLKMYCEKRELGNPSNYMLEFDGSKVDPSETAVDLDLDGGEMFDVRKSSKPTIDHINENKQKYSFDDDVLIA